MVPATATLLSLQLDAGRRRSCAPLPRPDLYPVCDQAEADIRALEARNARLEKDLEAAVVKSEVLVAKGAMCARRFSVCLCGMF